MVGALYSRKTGKLSTSHIFLLTAFGATFLLFSSVGSKQGYYLLPADPMLAILVANVWRRLYDDKSWHDTALDMENNRYSGSRFCRGALSDWGRCADRRQTLSAAAVSLSQYRGRIALFWG